MNKTGPIIIIEDDQGDQLVFSEILKILNYKNDVHFFNSGEKALYFLSKTDEIPFLILSDIDLPKLDAFEIKRRIHTNAKLSIQCIPYLLFASAADPKTLTSAYSQSVQGFFIKPEDLGELATTLKTIIEYWRRCEAPVPC